MTLAYGALGGSADRLGRGVLGNLKGWWIDATTLGGKTPVVEHGSAQPARAGTITLGHFGDTSVCGHWGDRQIGLGLVCGETNGC